MKEDSLPVHIFLLLYTADVARGDLFPLPLYEL
jgi:hypothetical protein